MSQPEFSIDYDQVVAAANAFEHAGQELLAIRSVLNTMRSWLTTQVCVGQTGNAAAQYIQGIEMHLIQLENKAAELHQDLQNTVRDFSGHVDPDMAQRFEDNN